VAESAGDHFSLRMSAVESSLSVSVRTEAHRGGRASLDGIVSAVCGARGADSAIPALDRPQRRPARQHLPRYVPSPCRGFPSWTRARPCERTVAGGFKSDGRGLVWVLGREPQRDRVSVTFIDVDLHGNICLGMSRPLAEVFPAGRAPAPVGLGSY
jgi:hypothetical protein